MPYIVLAFGSNMGERTEHIREAVRLLQQEGLVLERISSFYRSKPVGVTKQPEFVNAVALWHSDSFTVFSLLRLILSVEDRMGRRRLIRRGSRNIDIDLIFFGDIQAATDTLKVPHPSYHLRRFVLEPMCEIMPDHKPYEMHGRTIGQILMMCTDEQSQPEKTQETFTI